MPVSTRKTTRSSSSFSSSPPPSSPTSPSPSTPSKPRKAIVATALTKKSRPGMHPPRPWTTLHNLSTLNTYAFTSPLLIFFAITHTIGGLLTENDYGPAGNAAYKAMRMARFPFFGAMRTLHDFHMGFGLMCSVFLVMSAAVSSSLAKVVDSRKKGGRGAAVGNLDEDEDDDADADTDQAPVDQFVTRIQWILFLSHVANMVLCYVYFFVPPMVVSTLIALLLGWECVKGQLVARFG